jgi:hypothetical protein
MRLGFPAQAIELLADAGDHAMPALEELTKGLEAMLE